MKFEPRLDKDRSLPNHIQLESRTRQKEELSLFTP